MGKPTVNAKSLPWLIAIDRYVRKCKISGPLNRFQDIASDVLDGWATRAELDDLVKRKLLTVVRDGFDDTLGRDPRRDMDPQLCGSGWSVNLTDRLVLTLWPDRVRQGRRVNHG